MCTHKHVFVGLRFTSLSQALPRRNWGNSPAFCPPPGLERKTPLKFLFSFPGEPPQEIVCVSLCRREGVLWKSETTLPPSDTSTQGCGLITGRVSRALYWLATVILRWISCFPETPISLWFVPPVLDMALLSFSPGYWQLYGDGKPYRMSPFSLSFPKKTSGTTCSCTWLLIALNVHTPCSHLAVPSPLKSRKVTSTDSAHFWETHSLGSSWEWAEFG